MTEAQIKGFANFWAAYPKKIKKGDARKAWVQTAKIRPDTHTIVMAVQAQRKCKQWKKDGGQFIPYPATWLRAEQWDDVIDFEVKQKIRCSVCQGEPIIGDYMQKPYCANPSCKKAIMNKAGYPTK